MDADPHPPDKHVLLPSNPNATADGATHTPGSEDIQKQNLTSYCLPAQPVVAEASPPPDLSLSENVISGEEQSEFLGWEGRCHSEKYSCSSKKQHESTDAADPATTVDGEVMEATSSDSHCFLPRLVRNVDRFRIVQIQRRQQHVKTPVLFVGNVMDLYNGMRNTEYVPRSWFLSSFFGFSSFSKLPEKLETVLLLTAGLSAGNN